MDQKVKMILVPVHLSLLIMGCLGTGPSGISVADASNKNTTKNETKNSENSCKSDSSDKLCLGVKYVVYKNPSGQEAATSEDVNSNIEAINNVWNQCNINFQVDNFVAVDPDGEGLSYQPANDSELTSIRKKFEDDSTLLVVTTGTWNRAGTLGYTGANAWTSMPGEDIYGAILEKPVAKFSNIIAHELGHYLDLAHVSDQSDLMNPIIYDNSTSLSSYQCELARSAVKTYWQKMVR